MRVPCLVALFASILLALSPSFALAGTPTHASLPSPVGGFALNHACGAAVDSEGDIFVANAGGGAVEVFGPSGNHLESIPDSNEPCGLAVDSTGKLYVSEQSTGKVVRFAPATYPFSGAPNYGGPVAIDASGNSKGIDVDPADNRLYVAEGGRISVYAPDGTLFGIDEEQRVRVGNGETTGGNFKLIFEGEATEPIPYKAPANGPGSVQEALEKLSKIGTGNIEVIEFGVAYKVTFKGSLAKKDVPLLVGDSSGLTPTGDIAITELRKGFSGHIGEGEVSGVTGVAVYTYRSDQRYVFAAEPTANDVKVFVGSNEAAPELLTSVNGSETPDGELGLASISYLGIDQKNGHFYAYDATHSVVNEFEADGRYFTRIASPAFTDADPTAITVDRSGGANDGVVYVTAGASTGAKLLAFGPVTPPTRASLGEPPSRKFNEGCGTTVDSNGDVYLAGESIIKVFDQAGSELTSISDPGHPCFLAVDSEGNLYAANRGNTGTTGDESVVVYTPQVYPPQSGTTYTEKASPIETLANPQGVAVDPSDNRLFVTHLGSPVTEYRSFNEGSAILDSNFCGSGGAAGIDVYGTNNEVYIAAGSQVEVCNQTGTKVLARIDGSGSESGSFAGLTGAALAVDQSNGHFLLAGMKSGRSAVEEFEPSGAFVAQFGSFESVIVAGPDIAIDNSGGPSDGSLYVAYRNDLSVFAALKYGEPPLVLTGSASGVGGGEATLNGSVDPSGIELAECKFEYLTATAYEENEENALEPFTGATSKACAESLEAIGKGVVPVAVHTDVAGLQADGRYRFRLVAMNKFGAGEGSARLFGPPLIEAKTAQPVRYREATLRAKLDPSGLQTEYHFEYLTDAALQHNVEEGAEPFTGAQSTPVQVLSATSGPADIKASLNGLVPVTEYHFRLVAKNEADGVTGADQSFRTLSLQPVLSCPNETLRLENSSSRLPNCRAYELVTPPDTRGAKPHAEDHGGTSMSNNWLVTPAGPLAGESLAFFLTTTLPGTEGSGVLDAFRATRSSSGWVSNLFSPSFVQNGDVEGDAQQGVSPDQLYSFWSFGAADQPGAFPPGHYLRIPAGSPEPSPNCAVPVEPKGRFESLGCGSMGVDLEAEGRFISAGATHVIFVTPGGPSSVQLETNAPSPPLGAVYDRSPGGPTHVVSLLPEEITPASNATYEGASSDGSAIVFGVSGSLYLRRDNTETVKVASAPSSFAGISDDGKRVFYTDSTDPKATAGLHVFTVEGQTSTEIAPSGKFAGISADGSHVYYVSGGGLFVWDGGSHFIAALDPKDLFQSGQVRFQGTANNGRIALDSWTAECVNPANSGGTSGRANCPSRSTPDGNVLVFQSHADLTPPYKGQGHSEIYRYDVNDESLLCVSCDPSGVPATAEADLQSYGAGAPTVATTLIPGVSENGNEVFFQTTAALLPEDANSVLDVYEWQAKGTGGCSDPKGCLSLISSGQGDNPSYIYSMTLDGHDVMFSTLERLVGSDIVGSPSLYDARVEGGFPNPPEKEACHGDACQGEGSAPPVLPGAGSAGPGDGNIEPQLKRHCRKGRHRVKGRCVKPRRHKHAHHRHGRTGAAGGRLR